MDHIREKWTADDVEKAVSNQIGESNPSALLKLIEDIAGTPAGDWTECPLCLDVPTMPIMTICRHVFCSECINGVFDMPAARGDADGDDDDVEIPGETIACPVCRHKLSRDDIGNFTPPKEREPEKPNQISPEEAIEAYNKLNTWAPLNDRDSDEDSLPDLTAGFLAKQKAKTPMPAAKPKHAPLPSYDNIPPPDENEDIWSVFNNNPVGPKQVKKDRPHACSEQWRDILDRDEWLPSSKLTALRNQMADWRENYSEDKIIIFSQFVKALDLVEKVCDMEGWPCTRYHGEMTLEQRETSLRSFEDNDDIPIMLTSLKCGGVGLNLTGNSPSRLVSHVAASKVLCLDVWWNWQIENQAIDRYRV